MNPTLAQFILGIRDKEEQMHQLQKYCPLQRMYCDEDDIESFVVYRFIFNDGSELLKIDNVLQERKL